MNILTFLDIKHSHKFFFYAYSIIKFFISRFDMFLRKKRC